MGEHTALWPGPAWLTLAGFIRVPLRWQRFFTLSFPGVSSAPGTAPGAAWELSDRLLMKEPQAQDGNCTRNFSTATQLAGIPEGPELPGATSPLNAAQCEGLLAWRLVSLLTSPRLAEHHHVS